MNEEKDFNETVEAISDNNEEIEASVNTESAEESSEILDDFEAPMDTDTEEVVESSSDEEGIPGDAIPGIPTMGSGLGDMLGKLGGPDYSPLLKTVLETLTQFESNNEVLKNAIDTQDVKIKALTLFLKITGCISIISIIIAIIALFK